MEYQFTESYNELLYKERDVIVDFLKKQYDVRYGHQRDTWAIEPPVKLHDKQDGREVEIRGIRLDKDKVLIFDVVYGGCRSYKGEFTCDDFFYGELRKVIEALPKTDEVGRVDILTDLTMIQNDYNVKSLLKEYPFPSRRIADYWVEYGKVTMRLEVIDETAFVQGELNDINELRQLRDHLFTAILRSSYEYKELMDMLSLMENLKYECENKHIILNIEGSDMNLQVLSVMRSDAGELSMNVKDVDTNEVILLQEKEIRPLFLDCISEKIVENAIMDTLNCHNKDLVYKINIAWSLSIYQSNFAHILYAIAQRDAKEIKDKFDCIIKTPEEAMANAHMILENVCDDSDLETILNFIGWKDNVFNEE